MLANNSVMPALTPDSINATSASMGKLIANAAGYWLVTTHMDIPGEDCFAYPVEAVRLGPQGEALDLEPSIVFDDGLCGPPSPHRVPSIGSDGERVAIVWSDQGKLAVRRFLSNGAAVDPAPLDVSTSPASTWLPDISGAPDRFIFVWIGTNGVLAGAEVPADGTFVSNGFGISSGCSDQVRPLEPTKERDPARFRYRPSG